MTADAPMSEERLAEALTDLEDLCAEWEVGGPWLSEWNQEYNADLRVLLAEVLRLRAENERLTRNIAAMLANPAVIREANFGGHHAT